MESISKSYLLTKCIKSDSVNNVKFLLSDLEILLLKIDVMCKRRRYIYSLSNTKPRNRKGARKAEYMTFGMQLIKLFTVRTFNVRRKHVSRFDESRFDY